MRPVLLIYFLFMPSVPSKYPTFYLSPGKGMASASTHKLLVLFMVFLLLSLCSARTTPQPSCESIGACDHLKHLISPDSRSISPRHEDLLKSEVPSPEIALAPSKHYPRTTNALSHRDSLPGERNPLPDTVKGAYRMIWHSIEVILDSAQAYDRHHRIYEKLLREIEQPNSSTSSLREAVGNMGRLIITYGSLRLIVENLPGDYNELDNALDIIQHFAVEMLSICTVAMTYGLYQLALVAAKTIIVISLTVMEFGPAPQLIGR